MRPDERRVALVTGIRKGIGAHLARHLAAQGYAVIGCSRKPPEWSDPGVEHCACDVAEEKEVQALLSHVRTTCGRLDLLVNNAGIASMNHSLLTPGATVDRIMRTNFLGTFLVTREAARLMMKRRSGRIINLSTVAVPLLLEGEAVYAASKSAVETLTRIQARELGELGITVNAIGPSPTETDLIGAVPEEKIQAILARLAIKRLGTFADIANVVDFLAQPESDYITGQTIYLGGA